LFAGLVRRRVRRLVAGIAFLRSGIRCGIFAGLLLVGIAAFCTCLATNRFVLAADSDVGADEPAEDDDSSVRGPFDELLWMTINGGYSFANLTTVARDWNSEYFDVNVLPTRISGPTVQTAVGVRLSIVTLGVRGGYTRLTGNPSESAIHEMNLWNVDGEVGLHIPFGPVEPYFLFGGGFSTIGGFNDAASGRLNGANLGAGLGLRVYVSEAVSLEALGNAEVLFLTRKGTTLGDLEDVRDADSPEQAADTLRRADGSSIGTAFALTIGPGFHF